MRKGRFSQMSLEKWQIKNNICFLTLPNWEEHGARVLFSTRHGGISKGCYSSMNMALHVGDDPEAVLANRQLLMELAGHNLSQMICCQQVHGNRVVAVDSSHAGCGSVRFEDALPDTDGLATATPGLVLTTFYADCIPVFFYDPVRRVVALSHSGWKGTLNSITAKTLQVMYDRFQCQASDMMIYIGPGISQCCFEVQADLADKVISAFPNDRDIIIMDQNRIKWDLKETIRRCAVNNGVAENRINVSPWCTSCHTECFYSFRKEQGHTGRMAAMITLVNGDDE
jgi:YfiH family protein